jgi:hypothetical protein
MVLLIAVTALGSAQATRAGDDGDALVVRIERPGERLREVLGLFDGARAPDPAAALAAWRQATGRHDAPGKAVQALIAALNPGMVDELARLDGATIRLGFPARLTGPRWSVTLPRDDGTLADLATALAMTDGETGGEVWRLARGAASPVAGPLGGGGFRFASGPEVWARPEPESLGPPEGWDVALLPASLAADRADSPSPARLARWRAAAALEAAGCRMVVARVRLEAGDTLRIEARATLDAGATTTAPVMDTAWLDWAPRGPSTAAIVCLATDAQTPLFDRLAEGLDRVEKTDPARSGAAKVRARADLLALAVGVRPAALRTPLRGVTLIVGRDEPGVGQRQSPPVAVVLHTGSPDAADSLVRAIARAAMRREPGVWPERTSRSVATVEGRSLDLARDGADVIVGWGAGWASACLEAHAKTAEAGSWPELRSAIGPATTRAGLVWPGRLVASRLDPSSPLAAALGEAPPVVWTGSVVATNGPEGVARESLDTVTWPDLRPTLRRFLDRLPMSPTRTGDVQAATTEPTP